MALIGDFLRAVGQLTDPRFLWVLIKALGITLLLLFALTSGVVWLVGLLPTSLGEWPLVGEVELPSIGLQGVTLLGMIFASSFLMIPIAAVFIGFFLEEIADAVEARHYPGLPEARDIAIGEIIATSIKFFLVVIGVNLLALIPYLILLLLSGPLALILIYAVNGYLLGREYFELVGLRRLDPREVTRLHAKNGGRTMLAGALMTAALSIPIMNLIIPVLGVATITHQFHRLWAADKAAA